jgi:phage shock protein PspC (stress-responsive transcriptional regulator)
LTVAAPRPLRRSRRTKLIAGVCGGIAEWRGWNANVVRILFVVGSLVPIVPGFVVYVVLWALVPAED